MLGKVFAKSRIFSVSPFVFLWPHIHSQNSQISGSSCCSDIDPFAFTLRVTRRWQKRICVSEVLQSPLWSMTQALAEHSECVYNMSPSNLIIKASTWLITLFINLWKFHRLTLIKKIRKCHHSTNLYHHSGGFQTFISLFYYFMTERTSSSSLEFSPTLNFKSLIKIGICIGELTFLLLSSHTNDSSGNRPHVLSHCFLLLGIVVNKYFYIYYFI